MTDAKNVEIGRTISDNQEKVKHNSDTVHVGIKNSNVENITNNNLEGKINSDDKMDRSKPFQEGHLQHGFSKNEGSCIDSANVDTNCKDFNNYSVSKEVQEEDVPESFFDDLMSEDFIEGLNVVDTWEGDDVGKPNTVDSESAEISNSVTKLKRLLSRSPTSKTQQKTQIKIAREKHKEKKKKNKKEKDREYKFRSIKNDLLLKEQRRSESSKSRGHKISDSKTRRDPTKTHRDILRDKDKCEKDKTTKILHEKLKVVETGLVPPGTEMEIEVTSVGKTSKLEEGEIPAEQELKDAKKVSNAVPKRRKELKSSVVKRSPLKQLPSRKDASPSYKRERRIIRSRSRSPRRRFSPLNRSRSIERRIERRRRSPFRTRSRSFELSRSRSRERKYRYKSPMRKTSPLVKRNQDLFKEIDLLKAKLFSTDEHELQSTSRNIQNELTRAPPMNMPQNSRNIQNELSRAPPMNMSQNPRNIQNELTQAPPMNMPQNFMSGPIQYPPVSNQHFIPLQPVPPPHPPHVELDQQFFIGQPGIDTNPYAPPMQQPQLMHNPMMPPEMQQNFQPNWHMEPQPPQMNFYDLTMEQNNYQPPGGPGLPFMENPVSIPQQQQPPQPMMFPVQRDAEVANENKKQKEEEIFAKLFADNKITLSDYLSVSAKSTDNTNPVDIQNKIKVISYCQEALHEINGSLKATGKFIVRKSAKSVNKPPGTLEGLSPFKKVPVIKFQFTTYSKQMDDKPQLTYSLNRLMSRLGKEISFQEVHQPPPATPRKERKESQRIKWTSHMSTQTEALTTADFGCQVHFDDLPSPTKSILKKQSLANLTPAQLLAQAERETSPPPAPRWMSPDHYKNRWNNDVYRDFDDLDRRNFHLQGAPGWSMSGRNPINTISPFDRSPNQLQHLHFGNRP